ncbi:prenyltransferase [Psychrobium sp. 1_MG-2023]|uniref:prenyltransferase n=1 Tax=Psychrobium sp. 1_MG-2023 TaxID=3062624 RepID=UPI000C32DC80|nr:prenyltransferase [Psychrobium sp. 1_MG-2023]MDP2562751.1 prenyltransferase [Psychrobium sp. 1_MG-2023]PKF54174.1 prenyltransferase [Alteromonadales bacterium alter-6D02]
MNIPVVIQAARPNFLILTPVCIFLGVAASLVTLTEINWLFLTLATLGALLAHVSVNTLNEYADFKSGLDSQTIRTAFSGGSGALPNNPSGAQDVLIVGVVSLLLTAVIGLYFIFQYGLIILGISALGGVIIVSYTNWLNRHPWLCLVSPGLAFGVLMVVGVEIVLTGKVEPSSWLVALVPFFLVNNLLLLNQYPDIEADKVVGRRHLAITYGVNTANIIYASFVVATALAIIGGVYWQMLPMTSLAALTLLPVALFSLWGAMKHREQIGLHPKYLGANVAVAIITPLLLALSLIWH